MNALTANQLPSRAGFWRLGLSGIWSLQLFAMLLCLVQVTVVRADSKPEYQMIEWPDLIPDQDLQALMNPPQRVNTVPEGDLADSITSQLALTLDPQRQLSAYEEALTSSRVKEEYDQRLIKIPGFIVPLEFDDQQRVTEFFLVPFFGACLHLPPPPPNQILYAQMKEGVEITSLMDAFWLQGRLSTTQVKHDMALAAYSLEVHTVKPYYDN